jgi:hypothetical protein
MKKSICWFLCWLGLAGLARADMALEDFLAQSFSVEPAQAQMLWLTPAIKQRAAVILDHAYPGLRVKYWAQGKRTAWVLDEIGKEQSITVGVVVEQNQIVQLRVLAYRESRGGEVRHDFFTRQFQHAKLQTGAKQSGDKLDRSIDGITGATLSVNALRRVARLALAFHDEVMTVR